MKLTLITTLCVTFLLLTVNRSDGANSSKKRGRDNREVEAESDDDSVALPEAPFGPNQSAWFDMTVPDCFALTGGSNTNKRQKTLDEGVDEFLRLIRDEPIRADATNPQLLRSFSGTSKEEATFLTVLEAVLRERAGKGADQWEKYCESTDNSVVKMLKRYGLSDKEARIACEKFSATRNPKAIASFNLAEAYFKVLCIKKYSSKGALKDLCGKMVDDYLKDKRDFDRNGGGGPDSFGFSGFGGPGSSLVA